jgi:hypothetical protein
VSVLSYLKPRDLARFSEASRICRNDATLNFLWQPFLATHFALVKPRLEWGRTPASQFSALAIRVRELEARAKVCEDQMVRLLAANLNVSELAPFWPLFQMTADTTRELSRYEAGAILRL